MAAQSQAVDARLIDYKWYRIENNGPVFWATVNRFCAECVEFACPVRAAIQKASGTRQRVRLNAKTTAVQTACSYVAEYRETEGAVAIRRRRVA